MTARAFLKTIRLVTNRVSLSQGVILPSKTLLRGWKFDETSKKFIF